MDEIQSILEDCFKQISQKIQSKLIQIGVFFLMLLMIVITFFDIQKLFV